MAAAAAPVTVYIQIQDVSVKLVECSPRMNSVVALEGAIRAVFPDIPFTYRLYKLVSGGATPQVQVGPAGTYHAVELEVCE